MKLRTRKFLAGLLSLGLLLQAASPLSALAADSSSAAHTLTVTVGSEAYTLTSDGTGVITPEDWPSGYPAVSYNDGFVFDGGFNGDVILNGRENVTIKGASYAVNGSLNATVNDLTVTKNRSYGDTIAAIRGAATINCTGDVNISGNLNYGDISTVNQAVSGKLTVSNAQNVSIDGILNGGADITCDTLKLNCGNGSTVRGTLTVRNAQKIQATAYAIYGVIGDRGEAGKLVLDGCTGAVTLCNTYGYKAVQAGTVEVENLPTGYVARYYAGPSEAESTRTENANDCARYSYFRIEYVNPSNKTLTLTNAEAYTDEGCTKKLINATSVNGTSTYHVEEGKTVYVKAVAPGEHYHFTGWTEDNSKDEVLTLNITDDMTLTANWAEMHRIYIDGTPYKGTYDAEYFAPGKTVAIKAAAPERDTLDIGYVFGKWEKAENSADFTYGTIAGQQCNEKTDLTYIVMPAGDVRLKTSWIKYYSLTTVKCNTDSTLLSHPAGEEITITADETIMDDAGSTRKLSEIVVAPKEGYTGEEIKATGSDGTYTFIMPAYPAVVTAKYEEEAVKTTHTLTLTNAEAYDGETKLVGTDSEDGTTTYTVENGKELKIKAVAPDNVSQWKFDGWEGRGETDEEINVTVNENMALTANWKKVTDQVTNYGIKVTMGNNSPIEVTSENCGKILGDDYTDGELTYNPGTRTLTGKGSFGKMNVEITGTLKDNVDVVLSNAADATVVNGSLTVTGAKDVKVTGDTSSRLINGGAEIDCAGELFLENKGTGNVVGIEDSQNLVVDRANSVKIHSVGMGGSDPTYAVNAKAIIKCTGGDVNITSDEGRAIWDPVEITGANNVNITADGRAIWDSRDGEGSSISCSGKVEITSETAAALFAGDLKITGATDVTISGKRDRAATVGGNVTITCSGDVVLENKGSGKAVSGELKYTPDPSTKSYEIKAGTDAGDAASKEPVATKEEGGMFAGTVDASYISITAVGTPPVVPGDDDFTGGDSSAGGAVAAVIVGGAAVWGGYEIATRVILHNILPEGAEIPANRGQLALLVWNTAGRPEPVNTPAFADVADADTAKAAQWCVEQGLMDAKSESTFKPEGWMPKFKTIEVWEKAFPKQ